MNTQQRLDYWATDIDAWTIAMTAMRLSPETIRLRTSHITRLARAGLASSPWSLHTNDLLAWSGQHEWKRETARAMRSSMRRFWAWGVQAGRTEMNIALALPSIRPEQPRPRPANQAAVRSALNSADTRVRLMVRLANELGLRRGEVAKVHPRNDLVKDLVGWSLLVHGKGSRQRILPLPSTLADELVNAPDGYLFPGPDGDGHLSPHWVGTLVRRALGDGTTMHQLRHLCATELHDETHDLRLVQTVLGHASVATTQRYIAIDDTQMRNALLLRSTRWTQNEDRLSNR